MDNRDKCDSEQFRSVDCRGRYIAYKARCEGHLCGFVVFLGI